MKLTRRHRLLAVLGAGALIAAACGNDDDGDDAAAAGDEEEAEEAPADDEEAPTGDALVVGHIFPETGDLAFLGPPQSGGVQLALEDINAAGGVLGQDVEVLQGDESDDAGTVRAEADRLLDQGVNALIGAAASGQSQEIIQTLFDNEIVQCSPSNTSPNFTGQENAGFYFRMAPSDIGQSPLIAAEVAASGAQTATVAARGDDYGNALGDLVEASLADEGVEVLNRVTYDDQATTFDAEVGQLSQGNPDAVVLISFDEGATIIQGLLEAGITGDQLYGADGLQSSGLPELVNPNDTGAIAGMIATAPAFTAATEEFNTRLEEVSDDLLFGAHAYDCLVTIALAVEASGSTDPTVFIDQMVEVTREGTACATFEECQALLADGEDIDYDGVSGVIDLDDGGDPTIGRYGIAEFQPDGAMELIAEETTDFTAVE